MNKNTIIDIASIFKIEASHINTYTQDIDLEFIYNEISDIDKQVSILKQAMPSPFEIFSPSPYEEEVHVTISHFHKVFKQTSVVRSIATMHKRRNEQNKLSAKNDTPKFSLEKLSVTLMYNLMILYKAIGEFNQLISDYEYIKRTKLVDAQASFDEFEKFNKDYFIALDFTYEVFLRFYTVKQNRFYKVRTLIKEIEDYCIDRRIPYPKSKNSKAFINFYSKIIVFATDDAKKSGRSLKDYSVINKSKFAQDYGHLCLKNNYPIPPIASIK